MALQSRGTVFLHSSPAQIKPQPGLANRVVAQQSRDADSKEQQFSSWQLVAVTGLVVGPAVRCSGRRRRRLGVRLSALKNVADDLDQSSLQRLTAKLATDGKATSSSSSAPGPNFSLPEVTLHLPSLPELPTQRDIEKALDDVLSSIPTSLPNPDMVKDLPSEITAKLAELQKAAPSDIEALIASMPEQALWMPALLPAGLGALGVGLLALRRGRQYWMEELPLRYDGPWIESYWQRRPLRLLQRFVDVGLRVGSYSVALELDKLLGREEAMTPQRASEAKELITDLGPAFVKIVQVWASRPDVLPEAYQKELEKLLEQVRPFGKEEALETLRRNLGGDDEVRRLFDDITAFEKPIAAASIGQVYKAKVKGRDVAVKVQRPDVREQVTLDLFVIRKFSAWGSYLPIERYSRQFKSLFELIDRVAPPFIEELDYKLEANNQRLFAEKISGCELVSDTVAVPEVILDSREVLVQEWLNGTKLTEAGAAKDQAAQVVKVLLNSYMVQLLETGFLHGDPHPGNFVLLPSGKLGILDYGLMTEVSEDKRVALIEYIMHVQAKMYDDCLTDLVNLEFLPKGIADDKEAREVIVPGLANTLTILFEQSDLRIQREKFLKQRDELKATGKLEQLQNELQAIAKKYGSFRLPGYATLIIRALATLEGVGMRANNSFSLASETFPYIARRLLTDDSQRIRQALKAYLYKGRKRISAKRIDDLATGFRSFTNLMKGSRSIAANAGAPRPQDVEVATKTATSEADAQEARARLDLATQDLASVIFSPEGNFLQEILIDEGVAAIDALSRASLRQLLRSLGPFALPIALPLNILLGAGSNVEEQLLSREDKEALLLLRRIVRLIQAPNESAPEVSNPDTSDVFRTIEDLGKLIPVASDLLPTITPGAASFARRFLRSLASRALQRLAEDIERGAGLRAQPLRA
jgi:aarF domain-containing kinase